MFTPSRPSRIILSVATGVSCALAEDITNESDIVAGSNEITLTLTNDTWEATVGADNAITTALIDGITSAQTETNGWNNVVRDNLTHAAVARTSSTLVTITLPAFASYDITATETITATIPASALVTSASEVVSSPDFTIITAGTTIPIMMSNYLRMMQA